MDEAFHYPPELLQLLVEAIPRVCPRKLDVLLFFQGAGVVEDDLAEHRRLLATTPDQFKKHLVTRAILKRLNERGDGSIRVRRELLKRITEIEDYSTCWPDDQLKAKGLVAEIRRVVGVKDAFTKMKLEKDREQAERSRAYEAEAAGKRRRRDELLAIRDDLYGLFSLNDAWKRGKALEDILNRLFKAAGMSVREAFTVKGSEAGGIVEQIDGLVHDGAHLYVVEMKWHKDPLGPGEVAPHLVRVMGRPEARGIIISASGFTDGATTSCRELLAHRLNIMCELREIVDLLAQEGDVAALLKTKIEAATADRKSFRETYTGQGVSERLQGRGKRGT